MAVALFAGGQDSMNPSKILIVEDDEKLKKLAIAQLEQEGYTVIVADNVREALKILDSEPHDLILTDLTLSDLSGLELLKQVRAEHPETVVMFTTAISTVKSAVEAVKSGAYDYITKPINPDALRLSIARALEHTHLREQVRMLRGNLDQKYAFENIIGRSPALLRSLDIASRAAQTDATVLILGETGVGKELLAKAIHFNSARRSKPFITINCGAVPKDLLESELFGHVKGSFTGAITHKRGKIDLASGGTVLLDEIGDVPLELQIKLLRLIQEREIEKIGEINPLKVDVRIIAATHQNLQAMIQDGTFREDLYYRLNVIPIEIPPLRDRAEDVPELVKHFFAASKKRHGRPDIKLSQDLMHYLVSYHWPGNIRELENLIERVVVLCRGEEVTVNDLPKTLRGEHLALDLIHVELPPQGIRLAAVEKELIVKALTKFGWNQSRAARYLGISRKTLIYRMKKYGLCQSAYLSQQAAQAGY
jgi:DNA-binding NtrC family response regulator